MGGQHLEGDRAARWLGARGSTRARRWRRSWPLRLTLLALLIGACGGEGGEGDEPPLEVAAVAAQLTVPGATSITLTYPASVNLAEIPILGSGLVRLNDGVKVYPAPGSTSTTVVNVGTSETNLGVESKVAHVRSKARVVMRDRAWATGSVVSSSSVQLMNGAHADGGVKRYTPIPMTTQTLPLPRRGASRGPINLEPDRSLYLEPGTYDDVSIKSRSTLRLRTGLYQLKALTFEPQANLVLDDADGLVELFLTGTFTFRGTVTSTSGPDPKLFIVDTSSSQVTIDAPFRGTIIAPSARLAFISTAAGHYGTFFGKDVEVQPSTPIYHRPPDWDAAINGPSHVTVRWMDGSAILRAADPVGPDGITDGHVTLPDLINFKIPRRLRVEAGNAGNFTALLKYRDQQNSVVICTYRGGSSVAAPVTPLDVARGLRYEFVNCSNGATAGSSTLGSEFWLTIDGVANTDPGYTLVEVHLNGCGGSLDSPIEPADAVQMVEGFSWAATSPVPEFDADGQPALYYANIYIEDAEQYGALDDALIHYDPLPIFSSELEQFSGQCGAVEPAHDGEGAFVFAVLLGKTYNLLREHALTPDPTTGEDRTIFDVVILRTPPDGARNPDGSISFSALTGAGFLYRNALDLPDEQQQPRRKGWFRKVCRKFAKAVGDVVQASTRAVVRTLGAAHLLISQNDCHLHVTFQVRNRDTHFDDEMKQAWGARAGEPARPRGVLADFKMLMFPFLPTLYSGRTDDDGVADITVPRRGSNDRGASPFCLHLDNNAATVTSYLFPTRVCDYGTYGSLGLSRANSYLTLISNHEKIHLHNAVSDANRYFREVASYSPRRAHVLTGWIANHFAGKFWELDHPAWAPCLGLVMRDDVLLTVLESVDPALPAPLLSMLSPATVAVAQADIVYPSHTERHRNSRGVPAHEYGHFSLCSMLIDNNHEWLASFLMKRATAGKRIMPDEEVSILSDAFADLVASQVVGGVSYLAPNSAVVDPDPSMSYCASVPGEPRRWCLEGNANGQSLSGGFRAWEGDRGVSTEGRLELTRVITTWHDAFDGHYVAGESRLLDMPGNADPYTFVWFDQPNGSFRLPIFTLGWVELDPAAPGDDEPVSLDGEAFTGWISKWGSVKDDNFSVSKAMRTLTSTMIDDYDVTWCQACDLYTLHEDGVNRTTPWDRWMACAQGRLAEYVGEPPDPNFNMDASDCEPCGLHQHTIPQSGGCEACGAGEFAVTGGCQDCPDGTMISDSAEGCVDCPAHMYSNTAHTACLDCDAGSIAIQNVCTPCEAGTEPIPGVDDCSDCPAGQVSSNGVCHDCEDGTEPNPARTACDPCGLDETVPYDQATFACGDGPHWALDRDYSPAPGSCGRSHDVRLTGLQAIPPDKDITVMAYQSTTASCLETTGQLILRLEGAPALVFTLQPILSGGGCTLASWDIGDSIRQLGLDAAEVSIITDAEVTLSVTSGGGCPIS